MWLGPNPRWRAPDLHLVEPFGRGVWDLGGDPFRRRVQLGTVTHVGGGTSGILSATNPACSLVTSSAIMLKPGYFQPYGKIDQWYMWAGLFGGTEGDALARMANNSHAEVRLREDHRGNALAIRTCPSDSSLYAGLYLYGNGSATTLATGGALPVSGPPYLYTVQIDPGSITVWVGTVTATAFSMTVTGVTIDFAGPGVSVWAHGGAVLVDALTVRSDLPHLAPIRVSVERDGVLVPPDRTGISVEELAPRYITVRVGPDRSNTGTYRLPYPPIRRLSSQTQADEAAVEVYEWDEDNLVAGDQVNEFEIDIAASALRIRDQVRTGPLQVLYWSLARRSGTVTACTR